MFSVSESLAAKELQNLLDICSEEKFQIIQIFVDAGIKACMQAGELFDEQPYEISIDIHGVRDGPRLGRLRFLNKVIFSLFMM